MKKFDIIWVIIVSLLFTVFVLPLFLSTSVKGETSLPTTDFVTEPTTIEVVTKPIVPAKPIIFEEMFVETIPPTESTEPPEETIPEKEFVDSDEWFVTDIVVNWYSDYRVYNTGEPTTEIMGEEIDRDFLAKLLHAEAGGMSWGGKVYTCSAILNHCEESKMTLWECGHNKNHFSVAPYVDGIVPSEECYKAVDYVLAGGRIAEICYFRTKHYHTFGTPICQVDGHYFSIE